VVTKSGKKLAVRIGKQSFIFRRSVWSWWWFTLTARGQTLLLGFKYVTGKIRLDA